MCHPDPPSVIVINDSDQEDCGASQSDTSAVEVVYNIAGIRTANASGSTRSATRRGKSEPMSCDTGLAPATDTLTTSTSQLREVIVIDCDESPDKPPVRL